MSVERPTCNLLENNTQVYVPDPISYIGTYLTYVAQKGTAWTSLISSCCMAIIISIPVGLSYSKNGFDTITIALTIILLLILSSMSSNYMSYSQAEPKPDGYTIDCIKVEDVSKLAKVNTTETYMDLY